MAITTIAVNRPRDCKEAVSRAVGVIVLDIETTGIKKTSQLVSVGILVDGTAHVLFYGSYHASVRNIAIERIRDALSPLADRADLIVVGHNIGFDLGHLHRLGIPVNCQIRDTEKLLRLVDQDRGRDGGDVIAPRIDRHTKNRLNYKLKDVVPQLLGLPMIDFPNGMETLDRTRHVQYLTSDLEGTKALHDCLWGAQTAGQRDYHDRLIGPLTPIISQMTNLGFAADPDFIQTEATRLERLIEKLSIRHLRCHGEPLTADRKWLNRWLFTTLGLRPLRWKRGKDRRYHPSLDREHLSMLVDAAAAKAAASVKLIRSYREADSLRIRLLPLIDHVEGDGRIHTTLNDRQATGRISSSGPNLQQIAKEKKIAGEIFRPRNALVASPGFELVSFDVKQADIRTLAHSVESFPSTSPKHLDDLRHERLSRLGSRIAPYRNRLLNRRNPLFRSVQHTLEQPFYPLLGSKLADDFRRATGDLFYETVAETVLGRPPVGKERDSFKTIVLGTVNGQGVESLAKKLKMTEDQARSYLDTFEAAYPNEMAYKRMIYEQIALTGAVESAAGRPRVCTAHSWMANEPVVEILVSYRRSDAYWLRVVPIEPRRHVVTCWILAAWDARPGPLRGVKIFSDTGGKLVDRPYRLFDQHDLLYRLPARNFAWRSIRRVRTNDEEAQYQGFDATARSLFNHLCQAGTADIVKAMMRRVIPLCEKYGARMLLQIHDELVFECPMEDVGEFIGTMKAELELSPWPGFRVPILVDVARGTRFGELTEV